jgi:hypothetical protein
MTYQIVGYDQEGQAVYGDVMGDANFDVVGQGYPMMPYGYGVVGAAHGHHHHGHHGHAPRHIALPPRPNWRNQLAPGVIQPDEGMVPLPLTPNAGSPAGTFAAATTTMTFSGQLQKPYRAERLLVSVVRTGASAVGRLLTQLYVGTDLQQAEINGWDAELVGQAGAFGTRLTAKAAEPGVLIRLVVNLSSNPTGTDTIFASMMFLGRVIH